MAIIATTASDDLECLMGRELVINTNDRLNSILIMITSV